MVNAEGPSWLSVCAAARADWSVFVISKRIVRMALSLRMRSKHRDDKNPPKEVVPSSVTVNLKTSGQYRLNSKGQDRTAKPSSIKVYLIEEPIEKLPHIGVCNCFQPRP